MNKLGRPFPRGTETEVVSPTGEYAHENWPQTKYAVDFLVPVGTPVVAVMSGTVHMAKSDSDRHGLDVDLAQEANYVVIYHGGGTYGEYVHLGKDKIEVQEGQEVREGDLLGFTGLSGCMSCPHLHFNVVKKVAGEFVSIPFEIEE